MNYGLESYGNFEDEQLLLASAARKKAELEKQQKQEQKEFEFRFSVIKGYFLRQSWRHKKDYVLTIIRNMRSLSTLLKIISYISTSFGKLSAYSDINPESKLQYDQILIDHDRTLDQSNLKSATCEDCYWISTLDESRQLDIVIELLQLSCGGLIRKLYIPLVVIYNKKVLDGQKNELNKEESQLSDKLLEKYVNDTDKYPADHIASLEVEKIRRKWEDTIEKYRQEIEGAGKNGSKGKDNVKISKSNKAGEEKTKDKSASTKTKGKKQDSKQKDEVDWIQMLPIWIVKNILGYLDQKTLLNIKKVNSYWSYVSDSILKDRQARKFLDSALEKMRNNLDPEVLKNYTEEAKSIEDLTVDTTKKFSKKEKRIRKLMHRGAVLNKMVPAIKKNNQATDSLITDIPKDKDICTPLENVTVFPRLIKDDLLLYKNYPCVLKDVNILIDVDQEIRKQRDTLSYSLSQKLSDAFSLSEANLADW